MLLTCAWHVPPCPSILGLTYVFLTHAILRGKVLVNQKSTPTGGEYSLHTAVFPHKNGYVSSSKRTKHIKAKYFFIHHFHNSGELDLQYCPTEQMWVDILAKPLQSANFCLMRAFLMNCPIDYSGVLSMAPTPVPTLVPTSLPNSKLAKPFIPSSAPTNLPMKPGFLQPKPPLRGCVETKSHGTKVPSSSHEPILRKYESKEKNVS
jgi:hypothetical protein